MSKAWRRSAELTLQNVSSVFAPRDTDPIVGAFLHSLGLDEYRNERLLFHGSPGPGARDSEGTILFPSEEFSPSYAIKRGGFDERLGSVKGMYGSGLYFA